MPPKGKKPTRSKPYSQPKSKSSGRAIIDTNQNIPLQDIILPGANNPTTSVNMEISELSQPSTSQSNPVVVNQPTPVIGNQSTSQSQPLPVNINMDESRPVSRIEFMNLQRAMSDMSNKFMAFISAVQPPNQSATNAGMMRRDTIPSTSAVVTNQPCSSSQLPGAPQVSVEIPSVSSLNPSQRADQLVQSAVNSHLSAIVNSGESAMKEKVSYQVDRRIPEKVLQLIWEDQYVDLTTLISKEVDPETPLQLVRGKPGEPATWAPVKVNKEIASIAQWCELFDIYVAAYSRKRPDQTPNLLTHKFNVSALSADGGDYLYYDVEFRKAHAKYGIPWENPEMQIWVKAASKGIQTSLALAIGSNSNTNTNTNVNTNNSSYPNNNKSNNQSFRPNKGSGTGAGKLRHPAGYCFLFHNKRCGRNNCCFLHQCWMPGCGEKHSVYKCPKLLNQSNKNNKSNSTSSGARQSQSANPNKV